MNNFYIDPTQIIEPGEAEIYRKIKQIEASLAAAESAMAAERTRREQAEERAELAEKFGCLSDSARKAMSRNALELVTALERAEQAEAGTNKWINRCETASQRLERAEAQLYTLNAVAKDIVVIELQEKLRQAEARAAEMRNCQNCYHNIRDKNVCQSCEKGLTKWVMEPLLHEDPQPPPPTEYGAPFDEICFNPDRKPLP